MSNSLRIRVVQAPEIVLARAYHGARHAQFLPTQQLRSITSEEALLADSAIDCSSGEIIIQPRATPSAGNTSQDDGNLHTGRLTQEYTIARPGTTWNSPGFGKRSAEVLPSFKELLRMVNAPESARGSMADPFQKPFATSMKNQHQDSQSQGLKGTPEKSSVSRVSISIPYAHTRLFFAISEPPVFRVIIGVWTQSGRLEA